MLLLEYHSVTVKQSVCWFVTKQLYFFRTNQKQALERDHLMVSTSCRLGFVLLHQGELDPNY